jgi:SAM-dependent methyltransferase
LAERALILARDAIYRDFLHLMSPSDTDRILDVGVSDVVNDGANLLERLYPHSHNITAVGLGEGGAFQSAYPMVEFRQIVAGAPLPFADSAFDIVASNAVIEHVGSRVAQKAFVAELARVGRRVFLTAPNRWFPVEHHTGAPLAH